MNLKGRIFDLLNECDELSYFINKLSKLCKASFILMDVNYHLLASSNDLSNDEPISQFNIDELENTILKLEKAGVLDDLKRDKIATYYDEILKQDLFLGDIYYKDALIARMTIIPSEKCVLKIDDVCILSVGLSIQLRKNRKSNNKTYDKYEEFLNYLITGKYKIDDIEKFCLINGIDDKQVFQIIGIELAVLPEIKESVLEYTISQFKNYQSDLLIGNNDGTIYLLLNDKQMDLLKKINSFIRYPYKAIVSNKFKDLEGFLDYFKQVKESLAYIDNGVYYYEDILFKDVKNTLAKYRNIKTFVPVVLKKIKDYDNQYNTEYFITLEILLDNGLNKSITAKKMNVHLNTIKYRIGQMKFLFDVDVDDIKQVGILSFGIELLKN